MSVSVHTQMYVYVCVHVGQDEWMCVGGYLKIFFSYFV